MTSAPIVEEILIKSPFSTSDHNIIQFLCRIEEPQALLSNINKVPFPDFDNTNFDAMKHELNTVDWLSYFDQYVDPSEVYYRFCLILYILLSKHTPFRP